MKHPAKYTYTLFPVFAKMLSGCNTILDPFGGTGKIFMLNRWLPCAKIFTVEIEPEWADMIVGDALHLPFADKTFDAVCTSPTYGNRMADSLIDKYQRITYASMLGRKLSSNNSGRLQWGDEYRRFHICAWDEVYRLVKSGGVFVLNMKNHIRAGKEQYVTEWHIETICETGFVLDELKKIETPSMRYGQNREARVEYESVARFVK